MSFKVENQEDLRRLLVTLDGADPDAQQTINEFLKFSNNLERSNLPTTVSVLALAQLKGYGKLFYPNQENPFDTVADFLSVSYMARKGWKSESFVEMMKQTPNLADLQTIARAEEGKRSLVDRILGRSKEE